MKKQEPPPMKSEKLDKRAAALRENLKRRKTREKILKQSDSDVKAD